MCLSIYYDIIHIYFAYEYHSLISLSTLSPKVGLDASHYWLAATDEAEEGVWLWEHDKTPVPLGNPFWYPGQPSDNTMYNCAYMNRNFDYRWYNADCTIKLYTICFRDA